MDQTRFDDLTRRLGAGTTRRAGLRAALGGLLGVAALAPAGDGEAKKKKKKKRESTNCYITLGKSCRYTTDCCWLQACPNGTCCYEYGKTCGLDEDCCGDLGCYEGYCLSGPPDW